MRGGPGTAAAGAGFGWGVQAVLLGREQALGVLAGRPAAPLVAAHEGGGVLGRVLGQVDQDGVAQQAVGRQVELAADGLALVPDRVQHRPLAGRQPSCALGPGPVAFRVVGGGDGRLELLVVPVATSRLDQASVEVLPQLAEVDDVPGGVGGHVVGEGPPFPVGALEAFLVRRQGHVEQLLQQRVQTHGQAEQAGGHRGVVDGPDLDPDRTQGVEVVGEGVQDRRALGQEVAEQRDRVEGHRVHQDDVVGRPDLDQGRRAEVAGRVGTFDVDAHEGGVDARELRREVGRSVDEGVLHGVPAGRGQANGHGWPR